MKEEWLMPGAVVPVDPDTTKALVDEIKRLIGVIGGVALQAAVPVPEPVSMRDAQPLRGAVPWEQLYQPSPVQVSPLEFVTMVMEKEHLVGKPLFWAEWPNKEKNK